MGLYGRGDSRSEFALSCGHHWGDRAFTLLLGEAGLRLCELTGQIGRAPLKLALLGGELACPLGDLAGDGRRGWPHLPTGGAGELAKLAGGRLLGRRRLRRLTLLEAPGRPLHVR